jgi:hypothetical protein
MDDASVLFCVTRFPLALLPTSDESTMNYVGVGSYFTTCLLLSAAFSASYNFAENVCTQGFASAIPDKKP